MTAPSRQRFDWRDDRGQMGGLEAIPFGVLLFVVGALLVANAWGVIDAKMAAASAAREAARTYVESTQPAQAREAAEVAAQQAIAAYGRDPAKLRLDGPDDASDLARCNRVTFTASYPVPAFTLPWIGGYGDGFTVRATHSEIVDPFREGLPGEATCA
jgi:Flp pilus assembly protein TadG